MIYLILLVFALVFFVIAAWRGLPDPLGFRMLAAGLACWVLWVLVGAGRLVR
jgi:hypothetical protein